MKRFLLADDHHIVRSGLSLLIKDEFMHAVIDECRNGDCVWKKMHGETYDLVILDITMPNTDSLHLLRNILMNYPNQKVMIFTMNSAAVYAKKYLDLGVKGFVCKDADPAEVRNAIVAILNNRRYLGPEMQYIITPDDRKNQAPSPFDLLSTRELEIMHHLVGGKNVSAIAEMLFLHISTVSTHKSKIMLKLGVSNVIELSKMVQQFK